MNARFHHLRNRTHDELCGQIPDSKSLRTIRPHIQGMRGARKREDPSIDHLGAGGYKQQSPFARYGHVQQGGFMHESQCRRGENRSRRRCIELLRDVSRWQASKQKHRSPKVRSRPANNGEQQNARAARMTSRLQPAAQPQLHQVAKSRVVRLSLIQSVLWRWMLWRRAVASACDFVLCQNFQKSRPCDSAPVWYCFGFLQFDSPRRCTCTVDKRARTGASRVCVLARPALVVGCPAHASCSKDGWRLRERTRVVE